MSKHATAYQPPPGYSLPEAGEEGVDVPRNSQGAPLLYNDSTGQLVDPSTIMSPQQYQQFYPGAVPMPGITQNPDGSYTDSQTGNIINPQTGQASPSGMTQQPGGWDANQDPVGPGIALQKDPSYYGQPTAAPDSGPIWADPVAQAPTPFDTFNYPGQAGPQGGIISNALQGQPDASGLIPLQGMLDPNGFAQPEPIAMGSNGGVSWPGAYPGMSPQAAQANQYLNNNGVQTYGPLAYNPLSSDSTIPYPSYSPYAQGGVVQPAVQQQSPNFSQPVQEMFPAPVSQTQTPVATPGSGNFSYQPPQVAWGNGPATGSTWTGDQGGVGTGAGDVWTGDS